MTSLPKWYKEALAWLEQPLPPCQYILSQCTHRRENCVGGHSFNCLCPCHLLSAGFVQKRGIWILTKVRSGKTKWLFSGLLSSYDLRPGNTVMLRTLFNNTTVKASYLCGTLFFPRAYFELSLSGWFQSKLRFWAGAKSLLPCSPINSRI